MSIYMTSLVGWTDKGGREHGRRSGHRVTGVGIGLDYWSFIRSDPGAVVSISSSAIELLSKTLS